MFDRLLNIIVLLAALGATFLVACAMGLAVTFAVQRVLARQLGPEVTRLKSGRASNHASLGLWPIGRRESPRSANRRGGARG